MIWYSSDKWYSLGVLSLVAVQGNLQKARVIRSRKQKFTILDNVSGTLTPVSSLQSLHLVPNRQTLHLASACDGSTYPLTKWVRLQDQEVAAAIF